MMNEPNSDNKSSLNRRRFISNTVKWAALAGLLAPLDQACNNKPSQQEKISGNQPNKPKGKKLVDQKNSHLHRPKNNRTKWHYEGLVINQKTGVVHLPTAATYIFYDPIASGHLQKVNMNNWENQVQATIHFNKDKSGNILEALCLQKLRNDVNNDSLSAAATILSKAFSKDCDNKKGQNRNATNYRLHELMLQLLALNTNIPAESKWQVFNDRVKKPLKPGKRCKWMETEVAFAERVKYIMDREADYKKRLIDRASKYALT